MVEEAVNKYNNSNKNRLGDISSQFVKEKFIRTISDIGRLKCTHGRWLKRRDANPIYGLLYFGHYIREMSKPSLQGQTAPWLPQGFCWELLLSSLFLLVRPKPCMNTSSSMYRLWTRTQVFTQIESHFTWGILSVIVPQLCLHWAHTIHSVNIRYLHCKRIPSFNLA